MSMKQKELSTFLSSSEYDNNFDVDVFAEDEIAFFVNKNKENSYFIKASVSGTDVDSVDYTIYRKDSEERYEEWDGGIIECHGNICLQVRDLIGCTAIPPEELKDVKPGDIEFVEVDTIETYTVYQVFKK